MVHDQCCAALLLFVCLLLQFCINLANEKLQQHFNHHVFKQEQVRPQHKHQHHLCFCMTASQRNSGVAPATRVCCRSYLTSG